MIWAQRMRSLVAAGAVALAGGGAQAAVVGLSPNADLGAGPFTISLGGGAASYTFADSGEPGAFGPDFGTLPSVQTGGTATVASLGPPFFTEFEPSTYFTDPGRAPFFDDALLGAFVAYPVAESISADVDSFIGLRFELADGVHFGFARLAGLTLFDFAYETEAGAGIQAGPGPYAPVPGVAPIPLPAGLPLLAAALGALLAPAMRRRATRA